MGWPLSHKDYTNRIFVYNLLTNCLQIVDKYMRSLTRQLCTRPEALCVTFEALLKLLDVCCRELLKAFAAAALSELIDALPACISATFGIAFHGECTLHTKLQRVRLHIIVFCGALILAGSQ